MFLSVKPLMLTIKMIDIASDTKTTNAMPSVRIWADRDR